MANVRENLKNGKIASFRFVACVDRDAAGKQIRKYLTWVPLDIENGNQKPSTVAFYRNITNYFDTSSLR